MFSLPSLLANLAYLCVDILINKELFKIQNVSILDNFLEHHLGLNTKKLKREYQNFPFIRAYASTNLIKARLTITVMATFKNNTIKNVHYHPLVAHSNQR